MATYKSMTSVMCLGQKHMTEVIDLYVAMSFQQQWHTALCMYCIHILLLLNTLSLVICSSHKLMHFELQFNLAPSQFFW